MSECIIVGGGAAAVAAADGVVNEFSGTNEIVIHRSGEIKIPYNLRKQKQK